MQGTSFERSLRTARGAAIAVLALAAATSAQARTETLRWTHPDPARVNGFRVHSGSASGVYPTIMDVRLPATPTPDTFATTISVADDAVVYFTVTAYDAQGTDSPYSNEKRRAPQPPASGGSGGTTGGGTTGGGATGGEPLPHGILLAASFDDDTPGTLLSGWVDTAANNSFASDDSLFDVRPLNGSQVLASSSTAVDIHSHFVSPQSAGWSNYEVRGRVLGSDVWSRLGVTAHSSYPRADVYYRLGSAWQTGEWEIYAKPRALNDALSCAPRATGVIPQPGVWYRFRFQVEVSSGEIALRGKLWPEGSVQPDEWQAECSDRSGSRLAAGSIGLWSGATGIKAWDDLQVVDLSMPQLGPPGRPVIFVP